jgi:cytochrome c oxidase subunit 3
MEAQREKPAFVEQQFEDAEQQKETATLGMWTFLATEILFFGVMFTAYLQCRTRWPDAFREGSSDLKIWLGGINTAVLLTSSLFMALVVRNAALGNNKRVVRFLLITIALGVVFLGIKGTEYYLEAQDQLVPMIDYSTVPPDQAHLPAAQQHHRPKQEQLFMIFYFIITAFHALHMIVGVSVLSVLTVLTRRGRYSADHHDPIEIAGLYWHFVDIVWVFVYPTLYLLRQS